MWGEKSDLTECDWDSSQASVSPTQSVMSVNTLASEENTVSHFDRDSRRESTLSALGDSSAGIDRSPSGSFPDITSLVSSRYTETSLADNSLSEVFVYPTIDFESERSATSTRSASIHFTPFASSPLAKSELCHGNLDGDLRYYISPLTETLDMADPEQLSEETDGPPALQFSDISTTEPPPSATAIARYNQWDEDSRSIKLSLSALSDGVTRTAALRSSAVSDLVNRQSAIESDYVSTAVALLVDGCQVPHFRAPAPNTRPAGDGLKTYTAITSSLRPSKRAETGELARSNLEDLDFGIRRTIALTDDYRSLLETKRSLNELGL